MSTEKKHPDFNEWLLTKEGKNCNDFYNLTEPRFLQNRLFWAFDAGRNCIWDQYQEQKKLLSSLREEINKVKNSKDMGYYHAMNDVLQLLDTITPKK